MLDDPPLELRPMSFRTSTSNTGSNVIVSLNTGGGFEIVSTRGVPLHPSGENGEAKVPPKQRFSLIAPLPDPVVPVRPARVASSMAPPPGFNYTVNAIRKSGFGFAGDACQDAPKTSPGSKGVLSTPTATSAACGPNPALR